MTDILPPELLKPLLILAVPAIMIALAYSIASRDPRRP